MDDAYHKSQLNRLLIEIVDDQFLAQNLLFKGGTCAAMSGFMDRFSVDLDFDIKSECDINEARVAFYEIFKKLKFSVKDESKKVVEFTTKYRELANRRSTIKIDALGEVYKANVYESRYLSEIDRIVACQTVETMFSNKLVAPLDRFEKHKRTAGRDIYDIHHFFLAGYKYNPLIIIERTSLDMKAFLSKLIQLIEKEVNENEINQDLNTLLSADKFQQVRKILKTETLNLLHGELAKL